MLKVLTSILLSALLLFAVISAFAAQHTRIAAVPVQSGSLQLFASEDRWLSPYEVKNLPTDKVIMFTQGLQGVEKQYWYEKNEAMARRSQLPPPKESDVQRRVPFCITNMETELGPERVKLVMTPAPDKVAGDSRTSLRGGRTMSWTWGHDDAEGHDDGEEDDPPAAVLAELG